MCKLDRKAESGGPKKSNWYGRPNPEDRINRKPKDRIIDRRTELIENQRTEFVHMTESVYPVIPTFYIRTYLWQIYACHITAKKHS